MFSRFIHRRRKILPTCYLEIIFFTVSNDLHHVVDEPQVAVNVDVGAGESNLRQDDGIIDEMTLSPIEAGDAGDVEVTTSAAGPDSDGSRGATCADADVPGGGGGAVSSARPEPQQQKAGESDDLDDGHDPNSRMFLQRYFTDHPSLLVPSTTVRFRSGHSGSRVVENEESQIVLEERYDPATRARTIEVRRVRSGTKGLQILRAVYTTMCLLWVGIFVVFCVQMLLVMVLDLAVFSGETSLSSSLDFWIGAGIFLGLYRLCFAVSEGMVIAMRFVADAWSGHYMIKEFFVLRKNLVFVDWAFFVFLFAAPLSTLIACLFARLDDYWEITLLVWFFCVTAFFCLFACCACYFEVRGAVSFVADYHFGGADTDVPVWQACKKCALLGQVKRYSGKRKARYLARSIVRADDDTEEEAVDIVGSSYQESTSCWSRFTTWSFLSERCRLFRVLDEPKKLYCIDDAQGLRPFVTKWTWSLERVYCNPNSSRYIAIIKGPGAMTRRQISSSLVCTFIGIIFTILLICSVLTWFDASWAVIVIATVVLLIFFSCKMRRVRKLWKVISAMRKQKNDFEAEDEASRFFATTDAGDHETGERSVDCQHAGDADVDATNNRKPPRRVRLPRYASEHIEGPNMGLYVVTHEMRVTEAAAPFCWFMMALEVGLFYVWPLVVLYSLNTKAVATVYLLAVGISGLRHYFNIVSVIEETGTMNLSPGTSRSDRWTKQSRLTDVVDRISTDKSKSLWVFFLAILTVLFLFLYFGALGGPTYDSNNNATLTYLPDYFYPPQLQDVQYPTCAFGKTGSPGLENRSLADFAFLSSLAYRSDSVVNQELEGWFGSNENVTDESQFVTAYRTETGTTGIPVFFRLFRFETAEGSVGIVSVRGSTDAVDWLVNNQLWQAAILVQGVRALLPLGNVFTPALPSKSPKLTDLQLSIFGNPSLFLTDFVCLNRTCRDYQQPAIRFDHTGVLLPRDDTLCSIIEGFPGVHVCGYHWALTWWRHRHNFRSSSRGSSSRGVWPKCSAIGFVIHAASFPRRARQIHFQYCS